MRTRSGSLAAVMARVPSHPAHSGVLCICAANASSRSGSRRMLPQLQHGRRIVKHCSSSSQALQIRALGWRALFSNTAGDFNTGVGAGTLVLNHGGMTNTAVGAAALLLNETGSRNTAVGAAALVFNAGDADRQRIISTALLAPLRSTITTTGFSNNAVGDSALFKNQTAAANTAVGDLALEDNDATGSGAANNNTAVGASALSNNVTGSENTAVGAGAGPNIDTGFNNTYLGNFVGTDADERRRYHPHRRHLERERGRVPTVLRRWYLEQPPACWRQRCCSYSGP